MTDEYWMQQALKEAKRALGRTWPNPPVGAILVKEGKCLARGATQPPGSKHAERDCLEKALAEAAGATLYVTLEPCSHYGRTPPCTEAIIQAGVRRVVMAVSDPNPLVFGQGERCLREAGIKVTLGCLKEEARTLLLPYFHFIETGTPWLILKYAMTLDGRMALDSGDSTWISGEAARLEVQSLRREVQAILVGGNTVRQDNPRLDCRIADLDWQPARIIVTTAGIPQSARLFESGGAVYILTTTEQVDSLTKQLGMRASVHGLSELSAGQVIHWLGKNGFASILLEGGPGLITGFVREKLVNRVVAWVAPVIAGGNRMQPVSDIGTESMQRAPRLKGHWRRSGEDIVFDGSFI